MDPNDSGRGLIDEIHNFVGSRLDFIRKNLIKNLYLKVVVPINWYDSISLLIVMINAKYVVLQL